MGYIREPEGIDLLIKSRPLTAEEEKAISDFIQADKDKHKSLLIQKQERIREKKYYKGNIDYLGVQQNF